MLLLLMLLNYSTIGQIELKDVILAAIAESGFWLQRRQRDRGSSFSMAVSKGRHIKQCSKRVS